jgi:hypothetical protein
MVSFSMGRSVLSPAFTTGSDASGQSSPRGSPRPRPRKRHPQAVVRNSRRPGAEMKDCIQRGQLIEDRELPLGVSMEAGKAS